MTPVLKQPLSKSQSKKEMTRSLSKGSFAQKSTKTQQTVVESVSSSHRYDFLNQVSSPKESIDSRNFNSFKTVLSGSQQKHSHPDWSKYNQTSPSIKNRPGWNDTVTVSQEEAKSVSVKKFKFTATMDKEVLKR